MSESEFDRFSDTKLKDMLQQGYQLDYRKKILAELEKRNQKKDYEIKSQVSKTIYWGRVAAIAAIVAAVFAIAQLVLSIYH